MIKTGEKAVSGNTFSLEKAGDEESVRAILDAISQYLKEQGFYL